MKYGVTTATGHFGQNAVQMLTALADESEIVALARNVDKAKAVLPDGIEVRPGDYSNQAQLTESLNGIDRLLFISSIPGGEISRAQQHLNVVEAAKEAGVKFVAYTSFPHADQATSVLSEDHRITEKALRESGLDYAFLRNNWYLHNDLAAMQAAANGKPFIYAAGNGRVGWAPEPEYAEAAVKVLVAERPKPIYEFAGKSRTYADLANEVAKATGANFKVLSVDDEQYREGLKASGLDDNTIGAVVMIQDLIRDGELAEDSNDLERVLERPLIPLADAIKALLK